MSTVEFLWWRECPSWERALELLREEMRAAGLDPDAVELIEIQDEADAERHRFPGSPTIRVDGRDVQPPPPGEPVGLLCRVYRREDGSVSPLPDPAAVREALRQSADSEKSGP
mgnify:CR=1 FL=1